MRLSNPEVANKDGQALNASLGSDVPIQDIDPEYGDIGNPDAEVEETKKMMPDSDDSDIKNEHLVGDEADGKQVLETS